MYKKILFSLFWFVLINFAFTQEALKSIEEEYYDFLALQGLVERPTLGYRTLSDSVWNLDGDSEHLWNGNNLGSTKSFFDLNKDDENFFIKGINKSGSVRLYGPEWYNSYNSKVPYGQNDGALWQGVGYNTSFTAGLRIEAFGFEGTFKPQITWSQNKEFEYLPGVYGDSHSYFWTGNIDLVQRYGDYSYWQFDLGDTEIRYNFYNFTVGFGTQTPWLGPAQLNPMLGSNNAGTYPKFDFGLRKTDLIIPGVNWNLGKLEGRIWVGQLRESDYFDDIDSNNKLLIDGFNLSYSPSFFPEFTIGATKICLSQWGANFWKYLNPFYSENEWESGLGGEDQKCSIYLDLFFAQIGFDFYFEFGIDDYPANFLSNPFHTAIYTVGAQKTFIGNNKNISHKLSLEINMFEMSQDFQLEWEYMGYYSHGLIKQGYTNNGQLLGAGTGYFGNSQSLVYTIYYPKGNFAFKIHRHAPANNYIYNKTIMNPPYVTNERYFDSYMSYTTAGISSIFMIGDIDFYLGFDFIHIENLNFFKYTPLNTFKIDALIKYQL